MENLLGKNIFSLSGGEKQKIACASVSTSDPPIIVLDEPSLIWICQPQRFAPDDPDLETTRENKHAI